MRPETTILHHPVLGEVKGNLVNGVVQFLGIKYASLENRFSEPRDIEYSGQAPVVATRHGYVFSDYYPPYMTVNIIWHCQPACHYGTRFRGYGNVLHPAVLTQV